MAPDPEGPVTKGQLTQLTRLARKWDKPGPRSDLTYGEAQDAIRWMRNFKRMTDPETIPVDAEMQPNMTLANWRPYR